MKRIGVRELRQNASEHLRRVQAGETIEITDRGRLIARLVPVDDTVGPLEALRQEGRLSPASRSLRDLGPPLARKARVPTPSAELERLRRDER